MGETRTLMIQARQDAGLSQGALGDKVGLSRQAINTIERGAGLPKLRSAMRISRVLGQSVEDRFDDSSRDGTGVSTKH